MRWYCSVSKGVVTCVVNFTSKRNAATKYSVYIGTLKLKSGTIKAGTSTFKIKVKLPKRARGFVAHDRQALALASPSPAPQAVRPRAVRH